MRSQIDTGFDTRKPVKLTSKQVAADPRMTDVQADKDLALAGAKKELAAELGHEPSKNELKKSDTYQRQVETWKTTVKDTEDDIRGTEDGKVKDTTRQESIDNPGTPTIERETGKQVARKNFMAWAMDLMRDPEHPDLDVAAKVKAHFEGIGAAKDGTILAADARSRYDLARDAFAAEHTSVNAQMTSPQDAMSMRDRHEGRYPRGKLGHPLGLAMDFQAYDSPNLHSEFAGRQNPGLNEYMLSKFGGGRSHMNVDNDAVVAMGQHAAAGTLTAEDHALEQNIKNQYNEMAETSTRFQGALTPDQKAKLASTQQKYFEYTAEKKHLDQLKRTGKQKTPQYERLNTKLLGQGKEINDSLGTEFSGWTSDVKGDDAISKVSLEKAESDEAALKAPKVELGKMLAPQVDEYAKANHLSARDPAKSQAIYLTQLTRERDGRIADDDRVEKRSHGEMTAHADLITKLSDPAQVFGTGELKGNAWQSKRDVSDPSVMQLIEHGFVRNDKAPDANGTMFNADTVGTLARFGFAPGSNFGDTQHFDFVEGERAVITNPAYTYGPLGARQAPSEKKHR